MTMECAGCSKVITASCISALEKNWHPECFICEQCRKPFEEKTFHNRDGRPFCGPCWEEKFAVKCSGCSSAIKGSYITALDGKFHSECFVCAGCKKPFEDSFYDFEGKPYCEDDYVAKLRSK